MALGSPHAISEPQLQRRVANSRLFIWYTKILKEKKVDKPFQTGYNIYSLGDTNELDH